MATPNIVSLRIDERLIHGQGQIWIKALGVNTVIVANDEASIDPIQQTLMKTVVPKSIAMRFFSVQHTCDIIMKASPKQVIFIVCKTPEDALKLIAGGVPVKEINITNISLWVRKIKLRLKNSVISTALLSILRLQLPAMTVPRKWILINIYNLRRREKWKLHYFNAY